MSRSKSLPHVDLKRLRLQKQDSELSEDSSSGFKDSGIERDNLDQSQTDIQQDFPSLPSSSGAEQVAGAGEAQSLSIKCVSHVQTNI